MLHGIVVRRIATTISLCVTAGSLVTRAAAQIQFQPETPATIEARLKAFSTNNAEREAIWVRAGKSQRADCKKQTSRKRDLRSSR